jgi:hypothetical protein
MGSPYPWAFRPVGYPTFRHLCTYRARRRFLTHPLVIVSLTIIHIAEVVIISRPNNDTTWHCSSQWEATYSIRELRFNQSRLNHIARALRCFPPRYRHAVVPFVFRLQVSRLTHRHSSESILAARGIQVCVTRRTREVALRATYASLVSERCLPMEYIQELF